MSLTNRAQQHGKCCWMPRCKQGRCSMRLPRRGRRVCMSGSEYQRLHEPDIRLCDCILFWENHSEQVICTIELKAGTPDVALAAEQLQSGARVAETLSEDEAVDFFPILASGNMTM